jgi:hypothetical protein
MGAQKSRQLPTEYILESETFEAGIEPKVQEYILESETFEAGIEPKVQEYILESETFEAGIEPKVQEYILESETFEAGIEPKVQESIPCVERESVEKVKCEGDVDHPKNIDSDIPNRRLRRFGAKSSHGLGIPKANFPACGKIQVDSHCESDIPNRRLRRFGVKLSHGLGIPKAKFPASGNSIVERRSDDSCCEKDDVKIFHSKADNDHINQLVNELKIVLNNKEITSTERCFESYRCLLESEHSHLLFNHYPRFRMVVAKKILEHRQTANEYIQPELYKLTEELLSKHHDLHMDYNDATQMDEYDSC